MKKDNLRGAWPAVRLSEDMRVTSVGRDAEPLGLRAGDVIISVDGTRIAGVTSHAVMWLILDRDPGTAAQITVDRGGVEQTVELMVPATTR